MRHALAKLRSVAFATLAATTYCIAPAHGADRVQSWPLWQQGRVALERQFVRDEFRIFYTLTGPNALPESDQIDSDHDGVPDKIQNFALQFVAARRCYVEVLGLRHPFESPRYQGRVKFIDVNVFDLGKRNGSAGDAIVNYHRPSDPPEGVEVVTIDLAAKLLRRNLSPAHELFHVFQNGYSQFKNAWYYEGMASWSEDLLRATVGVARTLPADQTELEDLFKRSYDASNFWHMLARGADRAGKLRMPEPLREMRYVGSAKPIIEDEVFHGASLLKALLEEFDREDDLVSNESGLDPLNWTEARQRAPENNRRLWQAVISVSGRFSSASPQLRQLVESLGREADQHTNP